MHHMLSGPGLPQPPPLTPMVSPPPCPRPAQQSRTTGTNPRKPEGERTMEHDPCQFFFTERRTASEQGQGHRLQGDKGDIKFSGMATRRSG